MKLRCRRERFGFISAKAWENNGWRIVLHKDTKRHCLLVLEHPQKYFKCASWVTKTHHAYISDIMVDTLRFMMYIKDWSANILTEGVSNDYKAIKGVLREV